MTEAFKQWVNNVTEFEPDTWDRVDPLSLRAAKFWLHVFCDEVEKRARSVNATGRDPRIRQGFDDAVRELLGGNR